MTELEPIKGIYLGNRGKPFKTLIKTVLKKGKLIPKHIEALTSSEAMQQYSNAFTSEGVDPKNNYQVYEQLGDLSGNKFIVWYFYKRFPQLNCQEGVKVVARLRINYGSKNSFYKIAEDLGFWDFISATNDLRMRKKKPLLEDVFEAFLGVTETILDNKFCVGVGYACVYKILKSIFDDMNISLRYDDLYDAKTRLKELFDRFGEQLGILQYEDKKDDDGLVTNAYAYRLDGATYMVRDDGKLTKKIVPQPGRKIEKKLIGKGSAALLADAQQIAAQHALDNLKKEGYVKPSPPIYKKFEEDTYGDRPTTTKEDVLQSIENDPSKINEQFMTRGKSKYQAKYTSTILTKYCRERDLNGIKIALKMGADPNIPDSEGLTSVDVLLIGETNLKLIAKVLKRMTRKYTVVVHRNVYDVYYTPYLDSEFSDEFKKFEKKMTIVDEY